MRAPWAIITVPTVWPLMFMPRMASAAAWASSGLLVTLTPPALPRPPVFTCALTTVTPPDFGPICSAAARASSGVVAMAPASTGTPCFSNMSRAWYSKRSTGGVRPRRRFVSSSIASLRRPGLPCSRSDGPCAEAQPNQAVPRTLVAPRRAAATGCGRPGQDHTAVSRTNRYAGSWPQPVCGFLAAARSASFTPPSKGHKPASRCSPRTAPATRRFTAPSKGHKPARSGEARASRDARFVAFRRSAGAWARALKPRPSSTYARGGSGGVHVLAHPADDLHRRSAGGEDLGDAEPLELGDVVLGDDAAAENDDVARVALGEQLDDPREQRQVRSGEHGDPDDVGVLLDGRLDDLLRRLVQAGVDDLHSRVAQGPRDDLRATVVAVEPRLGHDHADDVGLLVHGIGSGGGRLAHAG